MKSRGNMMVLALYKHKRTVFHPYRLKYLICMVYKNLEERELLQKQTFTRKVKLTVNMKEKNILRKEYEVVD